MFVDTRKVCNMRRKRSKYGTLGTLTLKRKVGEPGKESGEKMQKRSISSSRLKADKGPWAQGPWEVFPSQLAL